MKVLVATAQVPFVRGGAEILVESLVEQLRQRGHQVDLIALPFSWNPPERLLDGMLMARLVDLQGCAQDVDRLIALKFPAYLIPHPRKVVWLLHQHRQAYELWGSEFGGLCRTPQGPAVRDAIHQADTRLLAEVDRIFTLSETVTERLQRFNGLTSQPLYHPPASDQLFYCRPAEPFLFFPSRLNAIKRQELVIEALAQTREPVVVWFSGVGDDPNYQTYLQQRAESLGVAERVRWLGWISDEEKRDLYARCLGVVYPPHTEDYGYITLEAMLASKPVVTTADAGGPLEFVQDGVTGRVSEPIPLALAQALDELWQDQDRSRQWGEAGRQRYQDLMIGWDQVIEALLS